MSYEPPTGMENFVDVLRHATRTDAIGLLRMAFSNAEAEALAEEFRLHCAAPALLDACKLALPVFEEHGIDTTGLRAAVGRVEKIGPARPVLISGGKDLPIA